MRPKYERKIRKLAKAVKKAIDERWLYSIEIGTVKGKDGPGNFTIHFFYLPTSVETEDDRIKITTVMYT